MSSAEFIHLRLYTDNSLGFGACRIKDIISKCSKEKIPAVAVSDKNNLFASLEFAMAAVKAGVQPIIGLTLKLHYNNDLYGEILLIARNEQGYKNLLKLSSYAYLNHVNDHNPCIEKQYLYEHAAGLIAVVLGHFSIEEQLFKATKVIEKKYLDEYKKAFGKYLFIEVTRHHSMTQDEVVYQKAVIDIAYDMHIPLVATNHVSFVEKDEHEAHDAFICIAGGRYVIEDDRPKSNPDFYFKSKTQMYELFSDLQEAVHNTEIIAKLVHYYPTAHAPMLPTFCTDEEAEIEISAKCGLALRIKDYDEAIKQSYFQRLDYELSVIKKMKYCGYFLIVSDFIKYSKNQGIPVGPGRGSGAGSIVAWALDITDLDPIKFGLLFERFLNPDRVSMPDFDIDFCQDRREEVINYVRQKYGQDKVAQILTFGKLQARIVLRDVGRVLNIPYSVVDRICKMVPNNPANPVNLQQAINLDKELQRSAENDPDIAKLLRIALKLEGLNRHVSTHAAGIIIADRPLMDIVPMYQDINSTMPAVQYSMKYAEAAGLVKFDFLGLKTLTVISWAVNLINMIRPHKLDINKIDYNDQKTYKLLSSGDTIGVFQFESAGMRDSIRKLMPDSIEDLIALGSLYRPGPMDNIPSYINRKHGLEKPEYLHPLMQSILQETYGIIVYQEQVMEIARVMGGYSIAAADLLRRAMGKKIKSEMDEQKAIFINGALANGISQEVADDTFALMEKFASYGFNKSHAAAYAIISYQTAYLKAHYPLEFLVASLNLEINDTDKINLFVEEAKRMDIKVLPPDINISVEKFCIEHDAIRYGLCAIKGVGSKAMALVCKDRKENGIFETMQDFLSRTKEDAVNKRILEKLIKAGVFDALDCNRAKLLLNIESMLKFVSVAKLAKQTKQRSLFAQQENGVADLELIDANPFTVVEKLKAEFEAFGFYLSSHPLESYKAKLSKLNITTANALYEKAQKTQKSIKIICAGVLISKKIRSSKRGRYAFIQLADMTGIIEASIFKEALLLESEALLKVGNILVIKADARVDDNGFRCIVETLSDIEDVTAKIATRYKVLLRSKEDIELLKKYSSSTPLEDSKEVLLVYRLQSGEIINFNLNGGCYLSPERALLLSQTSSTLEVVEI